MEKRVGIGVYYPWSCCYRNAIVWLWAYLFHCTNSINSGYSCFNEELTALEITKASFKWGGKNWVVIFGLIIVTGIVAELGLVGWGIRILFTAMLSKIPIYFIHKEGVESPNGDGSYSYFFGLNATLGSNMHLMFKTTQ
ncbi:hypothetical protein [Pareuzebyella sediminis]|uniref:hypothetical protein n=1 Tax=Pareuzebyella sediminis TaxID=2607998 RepID=UPI0011EF8CB9|nr:hypothetical protein [Pareuzebyella sediminis]